MTQLKADRRKQFNCRLHPATLAQLAALAQLKGISQSALVTQWTEQATKPVFEAMEKLSQ